MVEWCVEGIIVCLLDEQDGLSWVLLEKVVFYIVFNMNFDGSVCGYLCINVVGVNFNCEWKIFMFECSFEVYYVLNVMYEVGVDMYLDLYGDEVLLYNFVVGSEGILVYNDKFKVLENQFKDVLLMVMFEFQDEFGYVKDEFG